MDSDQVKFRFPKQFQRDILKALLQDKRFLRESVGILKPEYFEKRLHMIACDKIFDLFLKGKDIPERSNLLHAMSEELSKEVKVKDRNQEQRFVLKPIEKLLKRLYRDASGDNTYLRKRVLSFCRVQDMKRSLLETYENLEGSNDPEQAQEFLGKRLRQLSSLNHGGLRLSKMIKKLPQKLKRDKTKCITTGFKLLDKWMGGGMDPHTLTVFIAPTKFGKSMVLNHSDFINIMRNRVIFHFTLEISELKTLARLVARISGMKIWDVPKRPRKILRKWREFKRLHGGGDLFVKYFPTKGATVEHLRSYTHFLMNRHDIKPDLIVVDYGDLLRSSTVSGSKDGAERFIQGDVFENLRGLASEFNVPVLTASQCNRAAATKATIHMEDIAESYAKAQCADHIFALCGMDAERVKKRMRIFYAGTRDGEAGRYLRVKYDWRRAVIKEVGETHMKEEKGDKE